jgi:hypothetical protein
MECMAAHALSEAAAPEELYPEDLACQGDSHLFAGWLQAQKRLVQTLRSWLELLRCGKRECWERAWSSPCWWLCLILHHMDCRHVWSVGNSIGMMKMHALGCYHVWSVGKCVVLMHTLRMEGGWCHCSFRHKRKRPEGGHGNSFVDHLRRMLDAKYFGHSIHYDKWHIVSKMQYMIYDIPYPTDNT